jgi:CubicO group peptidase (beta-lactamase class C family)
VDPDAESVTISPDTSPTSYGHSGYTGTLMWVDPENELIFIFLSNRVYPTRENVGINEYKIRPAIHQAMYDYINAK